MHTGTIPLASIPGGLDLRATLESGQTFLWRRTDGDGDDAGATHPDVEGSPEEDQHAGAWHYVVTDGEVLWARQRSGSDDAESGALEWRATTPDAADVLVHRLGLDDDLDAIFDEFPTDPALERARRAHPGLRVIRDPFFPCLVSFVCSARTSVDRIHAFQTAIARSFGESVDVDGATYRAYPPPERLAGAGEAALRDLGLGFRAPYVVATAGMLADGAVTESALRDEPYEEARETLQRFPGVGPKVADCVCLFALGHRQAVPIDRWTRRIVEREYPAMARDGYDPTAAAFRDRFGDRAGYAQTYLYHHERTRNGD